MYAFMIVLFIKAITVHRHHRRPRRRHRPRRLTSMTPTSHKHETIGIRIARAFT